MLTITTEVGGTMSDQLQESRTPRSPSPVIGPFVVVLIFALALTGGAIGLVIGGVSNSTKTGTIVDVVVKEWSVTAPPTATSGDVTFVVRNAGTMPHELLVVQSDAAPGKIPLTDSGDPPEPVASGADRISEDGSVGETGGDPLEPGETRTFTVSNLAPGTYQLLCNMPGHYKNGMWSEFTVS